MTGIIIKGIAGFYYVKTDAGIFECKARGIFKKTSNILYVGDNVTIEEIDLQDMTAVITSYEKRKNMFIRPPVANVQQLVIVMALADPAPSFNILDRFLVMAERSHVDIVVCFNKTDLADDEKIENVRSIYGDIYPLVFVNGQTGDGIEELKLHLIGKMSALSGPSGVGKSTIINCIHSDLGLETGAISRKSKRGKHTTRHVEIFEIEEGGMIFDTPGFTSFDILEADEDELTFYYPEFEAFEGKCKYNGCRHISEPECAVKAAVEEGKINKSRYNSYKQQIEEIREREKNKY